MIKRLSALAGLVLVPALLATAPARADSVTTTTTTEQPAPPVVVEGTQGPSDTVVVVPRSGAVEAPPPDGCDTNTVERQHADGTTTTRTTQNCD